MAAKELQVLKHKALREKKTEKKSAISRGTLDFKLLSWQTRSLNSGLISSSVHFFLSHFEPVAMGTLKLAKTKCRWANIWPKDLAWASLMCASDRSRQDDGRVLGQVIYLVI